MAERVGVLIAGLNGATANTFVAGTLCGTPQELAFGSVIAGSGLPARLFADDDSLVFGGWDLGLEDAYRTARRHGILPGEVLKRAAEALSRIRPMPAYVGSFDTSEAIAAEGARVVSDTATACTSIRCDIESFVEANEIDRTVLVLLTPPLRTRPLAAGDGGPVSDDAQGPSAALYALAALDAGCAVIDFTPNVTLELPEVVRRAAQAGLPLAGRDGSTGQTLMKTVIGQLLRIRNLRLRGWYSTNFLGNADGQVLARSEHRELKMQDKLAVLEPILGYSDFSHVVDISFYPPRGDNKEAWDNVDFDGWFGLPMSLKINWLGRDSILAAPLVSDLVKHADFALRHSISGYLDHLGLYFKHPLGAAIAPLSDAYEALMAFYAPYAKEMS